MSIVFNLLIIQLFCFIVLLFEFAIRRMQRGGRLRAVGTSERDVANTFSISKLVNTRLWNRSQAQTVDDRPRSGLPRVTTGLQD